MDDFFWVNKIISLFSSITNSSALIDLILPTNRGAIMLGKITISLRGKTGNRVSVKITSFLNEYLYINDAYLRNFKLKKQL